MMDAIRAKKGAKKKWETSGRQEERDKKYIGKRTRRQIKR